MYSIGPKEAETAKWHLAEVEAGVSAYTQQYPWLTAPLLLAIVSRETIWGWAKGYISPGKPDGLGDKSKRKKDPAAVYHGYGFFQIDIDAHRQFIETGKWKDVKEACAYACRSVLIPSYLYILKSFPGDALDPQMRLRAAVAGYNCGAGNVRKALRNNIFDVDKYTAHGNYSADVVLERLPAWEAWYERNR